MAVNSELALFILKKLNLPNATKLGLLYSVLLFTVVDVDGLVKRAMAPKKSD